MLGGGIDIDIDALPDTQKIYYKATAKVTPKSNSLGAPVIANRWDATTGEGMIACINDIEEIGEAAFWLCKSLISLIIPNSVTSIGEKAFYDCSSLTSVTIPDSVTTIGDTAFNHCSSLTSITIPDSVTTIGHAAFSGCYSLTSITIPDSVTSISNYAFGGCSGSLTINSKIVETDYTHSNSPSSTWLGNSKFTELVLGDNIEKIGDYVFYGCISLTSVTIPNSVTSIGNSTFYGCTSLKSITIPNNVTSIGDYAFSKCTSLTSVYCKPTTPPTGGSDMFNNNATDRIIYVPTASVDAYKSATNWSSYADAIEGYEF